VEFIRKVWKDPVWSKVIAAGILLGIPVLVAYATNSWTIIGNFLTSMWHWLFETDTSPNWVLIPAGILGILALVLLILKLKSQFSQIKYLDSYTCDDFYNLKWRWSFGFSYSIDTIQSFCPECDHQLVGLRVPSHNHSHHWYDCPDCDFRSEEYKFTPDVLHKKVILKIQKNMRINFPSEYFM
jgi:hypothetical protein